MLDIAPHGAVKLARVAEAAPMNRLRLERVEEGFDVGVVGHRLGAVHALYDSAACQAVAIEVAAVLAATVGVEDEAGRRLAPRNRSPQCRDGEIAGSLDANLIAEQATRVLVDDHGQIAPGTGRLQVRDVAAPHLVGPRHLAHAGLVADAQAAGDRSRQALVDSIRPRLEPQLAHDPRHTLSCDALAPAPEQCVDTWTAVNAVALLEVLDELLL